MNAREACAAVYGPLATEDETKSLSVRRLITLGHFFAHFFRKYSRRAAPHYLLRFERIVNFVMDHCDELEEQGLGTALAEGFSAHPDLIEVLCSLRCNKVAIPDAEYTFDLQEVIAEANRLREQRHR